MEKELPAGTWTCRRVKVMNSEVLRMPNPFLVLRAIPNIRHADVRGYTLDVLERIGSCDDEQKAE